MALVTFDGPNALIIVDFGITTVDAQIDLYSDWKEWIQVSDNSKFYQAFRTIGGDPLGNNVFVGAYFFLQNQPPNNWQIRPHEDDHELTIVGNIFAENPLLPVFVPTVGNFTVSTRLSTSQLTQLAEVNSPLSVAESTQLDDIHKIHGLNSGGPLIVSSTERSAPGITQTITDIASVITVERVF